MSLASGPRCASAVVIRPTSALIAVRSPPRLSMPAMPHIALSLTGCGEAVVQHGGQRPMPQRRLQKRNAKLPYGACTLARAKQRRSPFQMIRRLEVPADRAGQFGKVLGGHALKRGEHG